MFGELFEQLKVAGFEVVAQALDDLGVIDGVDDVVTGAGAGGRGADLQRNFEGLRDRLLARVDPDQRLEPEFVDKDDVHAAGSEVAGRVGRVQWQPLRQARILTQSSTEERPNSP